MRKSELRSKIIDSLKHQGFYVNGHVTPVTHNKEEYKKIHIISRKEQLLSNREFLLENISVVQNFIPNVKVLNPQNIQIELREVKEGSIEEKIYRWWNLVWWSVPYQRAYGRQMRFLVWDKYHNCPFGLIGLQSPILKMSVRDKYLNISNDKLDLIINQSMQAQRLGALPPYNDIIGGKLVSLILTSKELIKSYQNKYKNAVTVIKERIIEPNLLFITTTSAFGKSSIYNRLKYNDEKVAYSLGYTKGSGTFHISNEIYSEIQKLLIKNNIDTNTTFGYGASRKMKLIDKAFTMLNLDSYHYHNIQREFFLFPTVKNLDSVITENKKPIYHKRTINELTEFWKERWAINRAKTNNCFEEYRFEQILNNLSEDLNS